MRVLYLGYFHENSGWSNAAMNYLLAMDSVGIDVVPRSVRLNDKNPKLPDRYYELERNDIDECDVVIQHLLPHHLKYDGFFAKNIALCVYELFYSQLNNWSAKINMMDELWVPSRFTSKVFDSAGVTIPMSVVPHTFDVSEYDKKYEKIQSSELDGNYIFYTIADLNVRKGLHSLIQAFHLEFSPNEPVALVIKSSKYGMNPEQVFKTIKEECDKIKTNMKLYKNMSLYKPELIIPEQLNREEILGLHSTGNCYVNTSHGEAFCIPLYEAMAMGKDLVCPADMYDYITQQNGYLVEYTTNVAFGCLDTFPEISSSREYWYDIDVRHLARQMRNAYRNRDMNKNLTAKFDAKNYSYEKIGNYIKELLNDSVDR